MSRASIYPNFFNISAGENKFDLIIGNPPWSSRGKSKDEAARAWWQASTLAEEVTSQVEAFMPNKEIAHAFMWKSSCHLAVDGEACLLVPAKVFTNKSDAFQNAWLRTISLQTLAMLPDWRRILFQNATTPTAIAHWRQVIPQGDHVIHYLTPKVTRFDSRRDVIPVLPKDRKQIRLTQILRAAAVGQAPVFWKKFFWGSYRDTELIDYLDTYPKLDELVGQPKSPKRWICGQGFKPFYQKNDSERPKAYGEPKVAWWSENHLYLNAKAKRPLALDRNACAPIGNDVLKLHRSPNRSVFQPPMVIVNQGFTRFSFCDFPVLFQHALQSISGPEEDADLLRFLTVVLRSKLASYFLFHTATVLGIERDKVHFFEMLRLPFFTPEQAENPCESLAVFQTIITQFKAYEHQLKEPLVDADAVADELMERLDPLVFQYFSVSKLHQYLIEDTLQISRKSVMPSSLQKQIPTLTPSRLEQRQSYVDLICKTLNTFSRQDQFKVHGKVFISELSGMALLRLAKTDMAQAYEERPLTEYPGLKNLWQLAAVEEGRWAFLRDVVIFDADYIYLLKPLETMFWTISACLDDADRIFGEILAPRESVYA